MTTKFWSDNTFEPKRKYRYTVDLGGTEIASHLIKKVDKPSWTSDNFEHKFLNHTFKYPGRIQWDDISLALVDADEPHTSKKLYNILKNSGYPLPDGTTDGTDLDVTQATETTTGKRDATAQLGVVKIHQYSGQGGGITGSPTETWTLHNAFIKDCKFGDLDYESEDLVEITLTLSYDWAVLITTGGTE